MVTEICIDLWSSVGEPECKASRCVQCGDVIDSIIVRHRQLAQACSTEGSPIMGAHSTTTVSA